MFGSFVRLLLCCMIDVHRPAGQHLQLLILQYSYLYFNVYRSTGVYVITALLPRISGTVASYPWPSSEQKSPWNLPLHWTGMFILSVELNFISREFVMHFWAFLIWFLWDLSMSLNVFILYFDWKKYIMNCQAFIKKSRFFVILLAHA